MSMFSFSLAPESAVSVHIEEGLLSDSGRLIAEITSGRKAMVLTHPVVADLFMDTLGDSLEKAGFAVHPMCLSEGESSKEWDNLTDIFTELRQYGFDRSDVVISLGGGVAGDIATVVAGLYMRGINLVHIPTTLLAQVDSCLGGKGAVNFGPGKNMLGLFYQPRLVIVDPDLLKTLPDEEMAAGYTELTKTVLLAGESFLVPGSLSLEVASAGDVGDGENTIDEGREELGESILVPSSLSLEERLTEGANEKTAVAVADANALASVRDFSVPFLRFLESTRNQEQGTRNDPPPSMSQLITSCLRFKATVVAADPLDTGMRQQLNLGHTFAHALEAVGEYSEYSHGQAVGLGLLAALRLSQVRYGIDRNIEDDVSRLLGDLGLPTCTRYGYDDLHPYFRADKKSEAGRPRFVGLKALGEYAMIEDATEEELRQALEAIFCTRV